jgi:Seryl-tRNA synthetase
MFMFFTKLLTIDCQVLEPKLKNFEVKAMINPEIIRKNPEILKENIRRREINFDVEKLIELDNKRRESQVKIDSFVQNSTKSQIKLQKL